MSKDDRQGGSIVPASLPPETGVIDARWDDDAIEFFINESGERVDPFDRVTAIPDMPPEEYAQRLMAEADEAEQGSQADSDSGARRAAPDYLSSPRVPVFDRISETEITLTHLDPLSLDLDDSQFEAPAAERSSRPEVPPAAHPLVNARPEPALAELTAQMKDRYAMGDFSGALVVAENILQNDPDHAEAARLANNCRDVLTQMYAARMGPLNQIVSVVVPADQIRWLSLDHRAGFLLSLVDGISSVEEILDVSGMPRLDALRIMCTLLEQRIISLSTTFPR